MTLSVTGFSLNWLQELPDWENLIGEIYKFQLRSVRFKDLAIPHNSSNSMVYHCANPDCATPLRYLRDGRLFQFEVRSFSLPPAAQCGETPQKSRGSRQVSRFWLCGQCSSNLTLTFEQAKAVIVTPLPTVRQESAAASPQASL